MRLLDGLFRSPSVEPFFTDPASVQAILDFEAALARAEARTGILSAEAARAIVSSCRVELFDLPALAEAVPGAGNLAIPVLKQLAAIVGRASPEGAGLVHHGATSQDALDTGLVLQLRSATRAVQGDLEKIIAALRDLTADHRRTLVVARTWLQHALPVTFGFLTAGWLDACLEHRRRLEGLLERALVLQFGGAVGTLAALGDKGFETGRLLAEELGLPLPRIPWHSQRERIGETAAAFALLAGSLAKVARDISLHAQTEVQELAEPSAPGRGGSSTLPHKQNPVACAAILAATSRVPPLAGTALAALSGEYQRSLGAWQSEWEVVPEIVRLTAGASHGLAALLPALTVDPTRMRENLEATRGLIYAEAVVAALGEKRDRSAARELVERACRQARAERRHLREILAEDGEVSGMLDPQALAALFEPGRYLGSADRFIDEVLAAARAGGKSAAKG
jgi:3-carboxy-cis,cis-muconate cycloisomerase